MKQDNGSEKNESEEIYNWRNEHGDPDFGYLESLAKDGTQKSLEKLQTIAEDLNANYNSSTSASDLVDIIRMATEKNEEAEVSDIN